MWMQALHITFRLASHSGWLAGIAVLLAGNAFQRRRLLFASPVQLWVQGGQVVDVAVGPPQPLQEESGQRQLHKDACGEGS